MTEPAAQLAAVADLGQRVAAAAGLEEVVDTALAGLDELLGHRHSLLLVHQAESDRLVTLASRGYATGGVGSEVALGQGVIGMAAQRRRPMRIANLQRMLAYARAVQRAASDGGGPPGAEIRLPGLPDARSQLAAPMLARGLLVGVVAVESATALAFDETDELALSVIAHLVGGALEREQALAELEGASAPASEPPGSRPAAPAAALSPLVGTAAPAVVPAGPGRPACLRHYPLDGSTFLDDAYLIKGVAGRLLWKVAREHAATGRTVFTNREARLDPALGLPAFRDNFESRLILLKRRLEEREGCLRIVSAGRGRFELRVTGPIALEDA